MSSNVKGKLRKLLTIMPAVARKGDAVDTGHPICDATTVLDAPSQSKVKVEGELVCCVGDLTVEHTHPPNCAPHTAPITAGSATVTIGGIPVARVGDACDAGTITSGASTVSIG